ncbi:MAG TPA: hypothetical protein VJI96_01970 [Candidatus Andersenbacteria bacterium]|nr:hypothetical protein [Candidatus Andersenbacteria bacterium]
MINTRLTRMKAQTLPVKPCARYKLVIELFELCHEGTSDSAILLVFHVLNRSNIPKKRCAAVIAAIDEFSELHCAGEFTWQIRKARARLTKKLETAPKKRKATKKRLKRRHSTR